MLIQAKKWIRHIQKHSIYKEKILQVNYKNQFLFQVNKASNKIIHNNRYKKFKNSKTKMKKENKMKKMKKTDKMIKMNKTKFSNKKILSKMIKMRTIAK